MGGERSGEEWGVCYLETRNTRRSTKGTKERAIGTAFRILPSPSYLHVSIPREVIRVGTLRRALMWVIILLFVLSILFIGTWFGVFYYVSSRVASVSKCMTRSEVRAKLPRFRERELRPGERPVWRYLHGQTNVPKTITTCEYRFLVLPWKHAALCVAYDHRGQLVGVYEYD